MGALMNHLRRSLSPRLAALLLGLSILAPTAAGAAEFTEVALRKHDAGTFYVDGAIQGYGDLRMLVDTGSSYLVISQMILDDLLKAGDARYARQLEGTMADGSTRVIPVYRLSALRLGDNCWIDDIEAAVLPGQTRAILGMNVLARLAPFTFSAAPPQLGVQQCQAQAVKPVTAEFTAVESVPAAGAIEGVSH
jgi:clan AA aspartic protease (TIGR02281 family)